MKLKMIKTAESIETFIMGEEGSQMEFNYIAMIKLLFYEKNFEDTEFVGEFSPDEIENINEMVTEIARIIIQKE